MNRLSEQSDSPAIRVAGAQDIAAGNHHGLHADSESRLPGDATAPVVSFTGNAHGSQSRGTHVIQSRGTRFNATQSPGLPCGPAPATRPATRQFTCAASVRLRTAQGWLTRPVDVHTWSCGETLVCLVRTATGSGTADTLDVETPRPQAHELCGC